MCCIPIAKNISLTFIAVLADVSMNNNPFSSAYCFASSNSTTRLFVKSALFPANAITIFGEACEMCACGCCYCCCCRHEHSNNVDDGDGDDDVKREQKL